MKNWKIILILAGLVLAVMVIGSWPSGKAKLVFCDVGQGDGVMLTKGRFQMLYDVGPDNGKMRKCVERQIPFWDRKLEVVIVSHWDKDHAGGLEGISRGYKIEKLYSASKDNEQKFYPEILREKDMLRSDWFTFEVVWPAGGLTSGESEKGLTSGEPLRVTPEERQVDNNEMSVVGVLRVRSDSDALRDTESSTIDKDIKGDDKKVLLMGDAPIEVEQRLVWRKILTEPMDVLKVGHHGSKTSTSEELLDAVRPRVAVIGVGKNSFGHPDKEVLERLEKFGVEVKRTDVDGTVVIEF